MKACNSCGKCCIKYSHGDLSASTEDLAHWENSRPEIQSHVQNGKIWFDPNTEKLLELCPWLRLEESPNSHSFPQQNRYSCAIYFDRPEDCQVYPATINDMIKDECEMLEKSDLKDLKQAQINLQNFLDN